MRDRPRPETIDDYIALAPEAAQPRLWEIRAAVERAVPEAEQGIKWSMPAYTDGRILVAFAAYKKTSDLRRRRKCCASLPPN